MAENSPVAMSTTGVARRVGPLSAVPLTDMRPTMACRMAS